MDRAQNDHCKILVFARRLLEVESIEAKKFAASDEGENPDQTSLLHHDFLASWIRPTQIPP
jgi:hypothetical protein